MKLLLTTLKKVLFWSYDRGSWQYDVMCVLILAFVFLGPNSVFHNSLPMMAKESSRWPKLVSREELGQIDFANLNQQMSRHLSQKYGRTVAVSRSEPVVDGGGNLVGYQAWEK